MMFRQKLNNAHHDHISKASIFIDDHKNCETDLNFKRTHLQASHLTWNILIQSLGFLGSSFKYLLVGNMISLLDTLLKRKI